MITCRDQLRNSITGRVRAAQYIEFDLSSSQTWAGSGLLNVTCDSLYIIPSQQQSNAVEQPSEIDVVFWLDDAVLGAVSSPYKYHVPPSPTPKYSYVVYIVLCIILIGLIGVSFFFIVHWAKAKSSDVGWNHRIDYID